MMQIKKITFIHLLNDFSGSPLVLSNIIRGMQANGYECQLITSGNSEGFLSNLEHVSYDFFNYKFNPNKLIRLVLFFWTQFVVFFKILKLRKEKRIIYINTLLPFGAALAGWLSGQKVVYHMHEISLKPQILKRFLKWTAGLTTAYSIYVSDHLRKTEKLKKSKGSTIHNALSDVFKNKADGYKTRFKEKGQNFTVLMLCSLKGYKGVNEFVELSALLPDIQFDLVINSDQASIDKYFEKIQLSENLEIFSSQKNVHPFYQKAHIVVNLSHPEQWVETFGMTILEGMYYGLPCIAPPVGGPTEIIENGVNGFLIDQRNLNEIASSILDLSQNKEQYDSFSEMALRRANEFNFAKKIEKIDHILAEEL